jgi:hypothetical protein
MNKRDATPPADWMEEFFMEAQGSSVYSFADSEECNVQHVECKIGFIELSNGRAAHRILNIVVFGSCEHPTNNLST